MEFLKSQNLLSGLILSAAGSFHDEVGVLLVLLFKLDHPSVEAILGHDQVVSVCIDQHFLIVVAHHKVVQVLSHQFRILFLSITGANQICDRIESFSLHTQFDTFELEVFWFHGKPDWKYVWRTVVGDRTDVLHGSVRRNRKRYRQSVVFRQWLG